MLPSWFFTEIWKSAKRKRKKRQKDRYFSPSNNLFSEQAAKNSSAFFPPCDVADGKFPFKRISGVVVGTELACLSQIYLQRG